MKSMNQERRSIAIFDIRFSAPAIGTTHHMISTLILLITISLFAIMPTASFAADSAANGSAEEASNESSEETGGESTGEEDTGESTETPTGPPVKRSLKDPSKHFMHPDNNLSFLKAEEAYRSKTKVMEQTRQEVEKLRVKLAVLQARSHANFLKNQQGSGKAGEVQKSETILMAEKKMKEAVDALEKRRHLLHADYKHPEATTLLKKHGELKETLDLENEKPSPSTIQIRKLTSSIRTLERKLSRIEDKLFKYDDSYKQAKEQVKQARREMLQARRSENSKRIQPATARTSTPDPDKLMIQEEINAAIAIHTEAHSAYMSAKMNAREKYDAALDKYNEWKRKEAEKEKEKKNKKNKKKKR